MTRRAKSEIERAGHRKLKVAVTPPPREIPVPDFFSILGDESGAVALAEWQRIVPALQKMGSACSIDTYLLREYCVCFVRTVECETQITKDGVLVDGQREGTKVRHPLVTVSNSYRNASRTICQQLGIGANVRGQMNVTPPKRSLTNGDGDWLGKATS